LYCNILILVCLFFPSLLLPLFFPVALTQALNRQIIKEQPATVFVPEIEFEIPPRPSRGAEINTVEGFLVNSADNLQLGQPDRYVRARTHSRGVVVVLGRVHVCVY
jgi:hypothetical protein